MPRTVSCSGPKNYITLEEHLQLFESPERTGQNSVSQVHGLLDIPVNPFTIFNVFKFPQSREDLHN